MVKNTYIHMRMSKDVKEIIQSKAKEDNRTLTNYILNLIKKDIKELDVDEISNDKENKKTRNTSYNLQDCF